MNQIELVRKLTVCALLLLALGCSRKAPELVANGATKSDGQAAVAEKRVEKPSSASDTKGATVEAAVKPAFYTVDHYDVARNPADDLATTVALAQAEKKNILIQVGGEWCGWCHLLSEYIETNEKVRDTILANYLVMKVTFENGQKNEAFLSQYPNAEGYPHLFVLDSSGKLLHSQGTAELEEGRGYNDEVVQAFLEKWKPER